MARSGALEYAWAVTQPEVSPPSQSSARELGFRVQAGFSAGEVRRLLEAWGATPEELEGDATTLAHRLVSLGQKRFGAGEMTRRLKAEKPLIEWPEDDLGSAKWAGPRSGPGLEADLEPAPTLIDTPVVEEPVAEGLAAEAPVAPPATEPERPAPPPASSNPMILLEPEAMREKPAGGDNVRYLVAGGAGLLVLTALAFGAGLAWNRGPSADNATESAKPAGPASILAQRAVSQLDEGLLAVASLCDLELSGPPSRDVLGVAQQACEEKGKPPRRRPKRPELEDEPQARQDNRDDRDPPKSKPASVAPEPARSRREEPVASDQPSGRGTCTKTCMRVQEECVAECGPEPKNASLYDAYLACSGKCITASSRCRTSCP